VTDEQYELLSIMLESKQLTHAELQNIHSSMDTFSEEDWSTIINWLHRKPNIHPKPMRRLKTTGHLDWFPGTRG
jgi:hypothetical protein